MVKRKKNEIYLNLKTQVKSAAGDIFLNLFSEKIVLTLADDSLDCRRRHFETVIIIQQKISLDISSESSPEIKKSI